MAFALPGYTPTSSRLRGGYVYQKETAMVIIATKKTTVSTSKKGIRVTPKKKGGKKR
jgi:hypothetical protein